MKCIEIHEPGGPEVLTLVDRDVPACGTDEVLIKVAAAGVNRPDLMQRMGFYPPPPGASDLPGLEVAGTVEAVGDEVTGWSVGDAVCALCNGGGYAEFVNVPVGQCLPIPKGLTMSEAASLPETYFTVWTNVFDRAALQPGETILIHGGTSGIGVAAIQMANSLGATAFATAGSAEKCACCEELGAEAAINYRDNDFVDEIIQRTEGRGVDVILDMVGGDYVNRNMQITAEEGRIVNIAYQNGFEMTVNFAPMLIKRLSLLGSTLRPLSGQKKAAIADALLEHIWPKLADREIKPVISQTFPLAQASAAHELMESGRHIGKIVLTVE